MKTYKIFILVLIGALITVLACDKVEEPYGSEVPGPPPECEEVEFPAFDKDTVKKVILLEEITGHYCPNCPEGHEILEHIIESPVGKQVAALAFHSTSFARPLGFEPFTNDWRTDDGEEIIASLVTNPSAPSAFINRTDNGATKLYEKEDWSSKISEFAQISPTAFMQLINIYDSVEREFCCHVQTSIFDNFNEGLSLNICLTEDSIIAGQNIHGDYDTNYVHMEMFRDALLDVGGLPLTINKDGESTVSVYKFEIDDSWKPEHCKIIAYIVNNGNGEVVQAVVEPLIGILKED